MKVKTYAFRLSWKQGITLDELFADLSIQDEITFEDRVKDEGVKKRYIGIKKTGDYWCGIVITPREIKTYSELRKRGGSMVLQPRDLEEGRQIAEFNHFIINNRTKRGLYQYYHNSYSLNSFCVLFKRFYNNYRRTYLEGNLSVLDSNDIELLKQDSFSYDVLYRKDHIGEYLQQIERIRTIEYEPATLETFEETFQPLTDTFRLARKTIGFDRKKGKFRQIKDSVLHFFQGDNIQSGRIEGVDPNKQEMVFKLFSDYDIFFEEEYEEVVKTVNILFDNLHLSIDNSHAIKTLLSKAQTDATVMAYIASNLIE